MTKAEKIKNLWKEWMLALAAVAALTMVCNLIGYGGNLAESIPGMVILCFISLLGLSAKELLPTSLPAVTYIGVIGLLFKFCQKSPSFAKNLYCRKAADKVNVERG